MSLKRAVKKQYYYCRMGSGCGSYLKIGLEPLEKAVWGVLQKLAEAYHEEEKACQSKKIQILSAVSKMKERKRILEIQAEHCKINRLDLYYQWREGRIAKEKYTMVFDSSVLPVLMVDTETDKYYQVHKSGPCLILPYDEWVGR